MKRPNTVIGLDIGTTTTIGIAVAMPDSIVASAKRPVTLSAPEAGWAEEDPQQWWDNSCEILRELTAGLDPSDLAGICVTGMLPAVVLLGSDGSVLRPSIQQSDGRCSDEVEELRREVDAETFLRRTGNGINQQLVATKLRWIRRHEPEVFERIATVFGSYDYINWRLTGVRAVEQNWALEAGFTDLATDAIADDLVALAGVPRGAIPQRSVSHRQLGSISAAAASEHRPARGPAGVRRRGRPYRVGAGRRDHRARRRAGEVRRLRRHHHGVGQGGAGPPALPRLSPGARASTRPTAAWRPPARR